jgi:methionine-rich copper-binding protein CopC
MNDEFRYYNNKRLILSVAILIPLAIMMLIISNLNPQNVYSHANPTSFTPPSNSVVGENGTFPEKVVVVFSERPEPKASYIHVTNSDNEEWIKMITGSTLTILENLQCLLILQN